MQTKLAMPDAVAALKARAPVGETRVTRGHPYALPMGTLLDPSALAERILAADLPARYEHVASVALRADAVSRSLGVSSTSLVPAAWLHDIGYAPSLIDTGFHPLDGARYLNSAGCDPEVVSLVAYHSGARTEARVRGLFDALIAEFGEPAPEGLALLTYCDLTTGPRGQRVTVDERIADILHRYGPDHVVHKSIKLAEPAMRETVRGVVERLASAQSQ